MPTARNIVAAKPLATGGILVAPIGTPIPDSTVAALDAAFRPLGYVGDEGVTETPERSTQRIRGWSGNAIAIVQTEFSVVFKMTLLETLNTDVLQAVYGSDRVTRTDATEAHGVLHTAIVDGNPPPRQVYVLEMMEGSNHVRIVIPNGQITDVGDISYADNLVVAYPITIEAMYDMTAHANALKHFDDGIYL